MPVFSGRVEAKHVVPTGGASVSASNGALSSAVTVTVPASPYYLTAAGGASSLLTTLQTQLNENVQGYPTTAAAMQAAVGYGTWSAGWLFNITSGNDTGAFGGITMTAVSSPTYGTAGPRAGIDLAIGFNSANDAFSAGDVYDVTGTDDLCVAWVAYIPSAPVSNPSLVSKYDGSNGWQVYLEAGTGNVRFQGVNGGAALFNATAGSGSGHLGSWHVGIATIDRVAGKARVGTRSLAGVSYVSAEATTAATTTAGTATLRVGDLSSAPGTAPTGCYVSAFYIGAGSAAATGLSANLSTALTNLQNAVDSSFSVSTSLTGTSATGRTTISNSFWPASVSWTSTDLRDLLGFDRNVDYPQTAAQMAAAVGYGTWSAGYLCNESSGNLASAFGTPATLTAASSPTYSNLGPRGGSDKAVGFDSNADSFAGGDVFDITGTEDLALIWVGQHTASPSDALFSKYDGGSTRGWEVSGNAGGLRFRVYDGATNTATAASLTTNTWYVGGLVVDRSTGMMRVGFCPIGGSPTVSSETAIAANSAAHSVAFAVNASTWLNGTTNFKLAAFYIGTGSGVATGLSSNLSTALSNFATYMKSQTGTEQAQSLWFPDCPLAIEGDPDQAPRVTDLRTSMSPTGNVLGLVGNSMYRHRGVMWSHVPKDRTWESAVTYANASWETFCKDAIFGLGHAWMTPCSPLQIYYDKAGTQTAVGYTYNSSAGIPGWSVLNLTSIEPKPSQAQYTGLFRIELGDIVSAG
jgi:hypothetical protein